MYFVYIIVNVYSLQVYLSATLLLQYTTCTCYKRSDLSAQFAMDETYKHFNVYTNYQETGDRNKCILEHEI